MFGTTKTSTDKSGKNKEIFSTLTNDEVMVSNAFLSEINRKSNTNSDLLLHSVQMKYKKIGANGETVTEEITCSDTSFYKISVSNVSHYSKEMNGVDLGSSPYTPNLELFTLTNKSGSKIPNVLSTISKRVGNSNVSIKQDDLDLLDQTLNEGGETVLVHECTIKMQKEQRNPRGKFHAKKSSINRFVVLLDGELFGPFEQVKIKPMLLNNKQMYLPIATFKQF